MSSPLTGRWGSFAVGAACFVAIHVIEWATWTQLSGRGHEPWFLNSGKAIALMVGWMLVTSLIAASLDWRATWFSAGAFVAMTAVLFLKPGGAGNIFPIVLAFGGVLVVGSSLLGAWTGREIAAVFRRRR